MRIAGYALPLGRDEIARHIDLSTVPAGANVRAYTLVHEGESTPKDRDTGEPLVMRWGRAIVRHVTALVRAGTKFVRSHQDRTPVGEVLGSWTAEVGGKLHSIVAGLFQGDSATGMDICSIEASGVDTYGGAVTDVGSVDAIAVGSSRVDTPGFPNAVLVGSIQCFADGAGDGVDSGAGDGEDSPMDLKAIKQWLETNIGVTPGQLFSDEAIASHPTVAAKLVKLEEDNADLTGQLGRRQAKDRMREKVKDWTPEAQFHADTAFDGWGEATDKPNELDEWLKTTGERYKGRTGVDVLPIKPDGENEEDTTVEPTVKPKANDQPNKPPAGGKDPVTDLQTQLGIVKKDAA